MIPNLQREALDVLAEVLELSPDVRIGQLLAHLGFLGEMHLDSGLGSIEDDEFLAVLYRHRAELTRRLENSPESPPAATGAEVSVSGSPIGPVAATIVGLDR